MNTKTEISWSTRVLMALTAGEEYPEIQPIAALADFIDDLNKPPVIEAISKSTKDFDIGSYYQVLGWIVRMQRELAALVKNAPRDMVPSDRYDAAIDALIDLAAIAPNNWDDPTDRHQRDAWLNARDVLTAAGHPDALRPGDGNIGGGTEPVHPEAAEFAEAFDHD